MYTLTTSSKKIIADTITPVSIYLKLRDKYPHSLLLESSDYHANNNSFSYICCNPIASINVKNEMINIQFPDGKLTEKAITEEVNVMEEIQAFAEMFQTQDESYSFIHNGLFGYTGYDSVRYFEKVTIQQKENKLDIPDMYYAVYQNIIAINHFNNEAYLFSHTYQKEDNLEELYNLITIQDFAEFNFELDGEITSNIDDETYRNNS